MELHSSDGHTVHSNICEYCYEGNVEHRTKLFQTTQTSYLTFSPQECHLKMVKERASASPQILYGMSYLR